jgi:hypothetical protein
VALSLVVPVLLSIRFAAPNYKALISLGIVSTVLYAIPLWLFELSGSETEILRSVFRMKMAAKKLSHAAAD